MSVRAQEVSVTSCQCMCVCPRLFQNEDILNIYYFIVIYIEKWALSLTHLYLALQKCQQIGISCNIKRETVYVLVFVTECESGGREKERKERKQEQESTSKFMNKT